MPYRKFFLTIITCLFVALLSACNGDSVEENIYDHLEATVDQEEELHIYQDHMTGLEAKEKEIYDQIIDLTSEQFDDIKKLANEALDIIEQRLIYLNKEKDSIQASEEEFEQIKALIEELKDEEVKNKADEMYDVMIERYRAYDKWYEAYAASLALETELYTLLQQDDTIQKDVTNQVADMNDMYKQAQEAIDAFSEHTTMYNKLKKDFYQLTDLNIVFEED